MCCIAATVRLPPGVTELAAPIEIASDTIIEGSPDGSILRASAGFSGSAVLVARNARKLRIRNLTIDGHRTALEQPIAIPPDDVAFVDHFRNNGLLLDRTDSVEVTGVTFRNIAGFAILAARSTGISITGIQVFDSGSRNLRGRNNTSGGILFEEGVAGFTVIGSVFRRIAGNAVWTHSRYTSPRNRDGIIRENQFEDIGRDAIQIGHATTVSVEGNTGTRIGFPVEIVDIEGGGIPVAIDTAGNVDKTSYVANRFDEINGKCIDLDGFHHGEVRNNTCVNRGPAEKYPLGQFGIVMNNSNPDMQSEHVVLTDNTIDGTKFGGIFVIGSGHRIERNRLLNLNTARCNESRAKFGCQSIEGEPDLMQTGIYLGRRAARLAPARDNIIKGNVIRGHRMDERCIAASPGIDLKQNRIEGNECQNQK